MRKGIAVAGSILVDHINEIAAYPAVGELTKILGFRNAVGGLVPNVGIDLKTLMPHLPIYAIGPIGDDADGDFVLSELSKSGLDTTGVKKAEGRTSFTDVMSIVGGQRTFFTHAGVCAEFGKDSIDLDNLNAAMLHLGYFLLLDRIDAGDGVEILKKASALGIKTSIDLVSENSDRYKLVIPALAYTDNLIINETEAGNLVGMTPSPENLRTICEKLMELGVRERVILHMPDRGVCLSKNGFTTLPSFDPPAGFIKGKTGAGDAFCAGALVGIYENLSDEEILDLGSAAAIASLSAPDAVSGMRSKDEVIALCGNMPRTALRA
jgi:sugar/nucleoside kinase (ribokinase family)